MERRSGRLKILAVIGALAVGVTSLLGVAVLAAGLLDWLDR